MVFNHLANAGRPDRRQITSVFKAEHEHRDLARTAQRVGIVHHCAIGIAVDHGATRIDPGRHGLLATLQPCPEAVTDQKVAARSFIAITFFLECVGNNLANGGGQPIKALHGLRYVGWYLRSPAERLVVLVGKALRRAGIDLHGHAADHCDTQNRCGQAAYLCCEVSHEQSTPGSVF